VAAIQGHDMPRLPCVPAHMAAAISAAWLMLRGNVLVQPEMERGRSPLVSIPPFGRGFSRHRYDHQAIPHRLRPRKARFRFAWQDHCSSTMPIRLSFRLPRNTSRIDAKRGNHFLQADLPGRSRVVRR
jgi:hypothetical protein